MKIQETMSASGSLPLKQPEGNPVDQARGDFGTLVREAVSQTAAAEKRGEHAIRDLAGGQAKNLHEVILEMEKADLSLKMLVQFRNKALDAYETIMRMQV